MFRFTVVVLVWIAAASQVCAEEPAAVLGTSVALHWAEFKHIPGVTDARGIPFGEGDARPYFLHIQAVVTVGDVAEAHLGEGIMLGTSKVYPVNMKLTKEGKQKLEQTGEPGKSRLLACVIDGVRDGSAFYVDVKDLSKFSYMLGLYGQQDAEKLVAGINAASAEARRVKSGK